MNPQFHNLWTENIYHNLRDFIDTKDHTRQGLPCLELLKIPYNSSETKCFHGVVTDRFCGLVFFGFTISKIEDKIR